LAAIFAGGRGVRGLRLKLAPQEQKEYSLNGQQWLFWLRGKGDPRFSSKVHTQYTGGLIFFSARGLQIGIYVKVKFTIHTLFITREIGK